MKLLVATGETQGQRENDFCFVPEGEIVRPNAMTCEGAQTDDHCGCARSWSGIECDKATTTMKVVEIDITLKQLQQKLATAFYRGGWGDIPGNRPNPKVAEQLIGIASLFPVGTILEYRDNRLSSRRI